MSPEHFRRRADDYRDAAMCCEQNDEKSGDLYSIAALFSAMANDLERRGNAPPQRAARMMGLFARKAA